MRKVKASVIVCQGFGPCPNVYIGCEPPPEVLASWRDKEIKTFGKVIEKRDADGNVYATRDRWLVKVEETFVFLGDSALVDWAEPEPEPAAATTGFSEVSVVAKGKVTPKA